MGVGELPSSQNPPCSSHHLAIFFFWRAVGYICEICVCKCVCSCVFLCRKRTQGHMACEPYIRTDSGSGCERGWSNYPYRLYPLVDQSITTLQRCTGLTIIHRNMCEHTFLVCWCGFTFNQMKLNQRLQLLCAKDGCLSRLINCLTKHK